MKVKYFSDTDTAYIEFSNQEVAETKDINENILLDLDKNDQLVGMTIEHADGQANLSEFSFQQLTKKPLNFHPISQAEECLPSTPFSSISLAGNHPNLSLRYGHFQHVDVVGSSSLTLKSGLDNLSETVR